MGQQGRRPDKAGATVRRPKASRRPQDGPSRAVGYIRVSTDDQADEERAAGLEAQRAAIRGECHRRGWQLLAIEEDAGISGSSMRSRPALQRALGSVEGGEASILCVAKLDRLSRSLIDAAGILARAQRCGWQLVVLDLGLDLTTAAGELVAHVVASAAQYERRMIGQRTRDALAVKRAQGVRLGRPRRVPDDVVRHISARRAEGASYPVIAAELNAGGVPTAQGGRSWHPATVRKALLSAEREGVAA